MQMALTFDTPLARSSDPSTSHGAADAAKELQARHHRVIVACLEAHGALGKDGIAARTQLTGVAVARRTVELERAGLIRWTGKTVKSTAGRDEREWGAV
jgi:predicted ArsR family transcriptional regulator